MTDAEFPTGLYAKRPSAAAPEFIILNLSARRAELLEWLASRDDEWVTMQVKESRSGKMYIQVDNWKPKSDGGQASPSVASYSPSEFEDDIPF